MSADDGNHIHAEVPEGVHPEEPREHESPRFQKWWVGGWLAPILVTLGTLAWCFLIYGLIGDRPRNWEYGVTPYVPGESIFSTEPVPAGPVPREVELPNEEPGVEDEVP